ncbi:ABC transporter ATP-binding protein [Virgisporangium aurantiacum]|uniref:ABC transporter ATP-binding protein n=1 Tax=Virgisporangium aurantiacum TaxID=175570 RepID=A0A8J4DXA9_9ACTN|nr:ABC transporter ATP-binding protein [Virgisporangium aurantiacum]GIJ53381.1 ABC transporter ATP-binding protein [Virgisporangium aurantiacum]
MIIARNLVVRFGQTLALAGTSIGLAPGEVVAVMGPSGSGKSTLLHVLAGILRPDQGEIHVGHQRIDNLPDAARSRMRLKAFGFVLQFGDLVPELSLRENVELPLRLLKVSRAEAREKARGLLTELEIDDVADRRPGQVSGGQAQRAAVARSLVHQPSVIFADEPTGALDSASGETVLDSFTELARRRATTVLLVTHEARVAAYADRTMYLRDGKLA